MRGSEANFPLFPEVDGGEGASMGISATVSYFNESQELIRLSHYQVDFSQLALIVALN